MRARYDPLDRRQKLAAAILMSAVDLPQPLGDFGKLTLAAAKLCPGCGVDEIRYGQGRRVALTQARSLIDEMLAEMPDVP
jgi:hypothetical protein